MVMSGDFPKSWRARLADHCREAKSEGEAMILAILHVSPRRCPAFADNAGIDKDGIVWSTFKKRNGELVTLAPLGRAEWCRDQVRRITDRLRLDDDERTALFDEFRKWIAVDLRAAGKAEL